jgi:hypothetical protein
MFIPYPDVSLSGMCEHVVKGKKGTVCARLHCVLACSQRCSPFLFLPTVDVAALHTPNEDMPRCFDSWPRPRIYRPLSPALAKKDLAKLVLPCRSWLSLA